MEKHDLLFFCTLCKNKSPEEIERIKCTIPHTVKLYKRGESIAFYGEQISHLMMLIKGKVKTEIVSASGLTLPIEEIVAPYPLAASFLFADIDHLPVQIVALEKCEVIFISKEAIERQIAKCPSFLHGFMTFNANNMCRVSERLKIFAQKGIKAKIAYYIFTHEKEGHFDLERSVASLADFFAVERPSLSRAISELIRDGIIAYENGKGKILNQQKLEEFFF